MFKRFSLPGAIALCFFGAINAPGQTAPTAVKITLGTHNVEAGLRVPSEGDGINAPDMVGGLSARHAVAPTGHFIYVAVDWPDTTARSIDAYVIVEAYDDNMHELRTVYDKDTPTPTAASKYTPANQVILLTGSGRWRKSCVFLPALRLEHGENYGADFRLLATATAIHSIEVTTRKPDGFDANAAVEAESLRTVRVERPSGIELTFGTEITPANAAIFKSLGATSAESYVNWAEVEPQEDKWDWSKFDKQVAVLQAEGLKWTPMLVAGPAYATPLWFQNGPHSHFFRCLEHGQDCRVQSIFNPDLRRYVDRFLLAFSQRYRDSGVLESVLLGSSGVYGESIYPAGGPGGWTTALTGEYHCHGGWWAGDSYAAASFRKAMQKAYPDISVLNIAWKTQYKSFDEVAPFLPDSTPSDHARADFVDWYEQSMTDWAAFWAGAARTAFPNTEIYLCTGGNGDVMLGADFTAQAAALAPFGVGMRVTNEGSNYRQNFSITREVATATRFYGTFFGLEPAGQLDANGVVACIYNAAASGARARFFYDHDVLATIPQRENFRAFSRSLTTRHPQVDLAFYLSHESWALDPKSLRGCYQDSVLLRGVADHDYVTRRSIDDGILKNYHALVLADSPVLKPDVAAAIERWVEEGGTLVAVMRNDTTLGGRLYDNTAWREKMFGPLLNAGAGRPRITRVKRGSVVVVDDSAHSPRIAQEFTAALAEAAAASPGGKLRAASATESDGRIVTKTREGTIWFDGATGKMGSL